MPAQLWPVLPLVPAERVPAVLVRAPALNLLPVAPAQAAAGVLVPAAVYSAWEVTSSRHFLVSAAGLPVVVLPGLPAVGCPWWCWVVSGFAGLVLGKLSPLFVVQL